MVGMIDIRQTIIYNIVKQKGVIHVLSQSTRKTASGVTSP
jgi:hypothetical protein